MIVQPVAYNNQLCYRFFRHNGKETTLPQLCQYSAQPLNQEKFAAVASLTFVLILFGTSADRKAVAGKGPKGDREMKKMRKLYLPLLL
jgi:hypothetical protein